MAIIFHRAVPSGLASFSHSHKQNNSARWIKPKRANCGSEQCVCVSLVQHPAFEKFSKEDINAFICTPNSNDSASIEELPPGEDIGMVMKQIHKQEQLLENCIQMMQSLSQKVEKVRTRARTGTTVACLDTVRIDPEMIPARSQDDLRCLNNALKQAEIFHKWVEQMEMLGGTNPADITRRILSVLVTTELAKSMNWMGRGKKIAFSSFNGIVHLIIFLLDFKRNLYICDCGKSYAYQATLTRHRRYECHREKRFKCPLCPYRAHQRFNVMAHMARRHRNINDYKDITCD